MMLPHAYTPYDHDRGVEDVVLAHPDKWEQAKSDPNLISWFVGQVMKESNGRANPDLVRKLLEWKLGD